MATKRDSNTVSGEHQFSADRPIESLDDDELGRAEFAVALADSIRGWQERDSLVIGIYAQWGNGKTSFKNMVLDALKKCKTKAPHTVEFNPWQWSSQEQIAEAFFREIGMALEFKQGSRSKEDRKRKERIQKWWEYTARLGLIGTEIASELLLPSAAAQVSKKLSNVGAKALDKRAEKVKPQNLEDTRKDVINLMLDMPFPLLVVIDDIDRLTPKEIRRVLQLVKSNADFPNLIYLLLFEKEIIEKGLEKGEEGVPDGIGRDYLEKIVNVCFDLPIIESITILDYIHEKIDKWFIEFEVVETEKSRFDTLEREALAGFFGNFRNAKRFLATIDFHLNRFRSGKVLDVSVVDLIALETLRVFEPASYKQIPQYGFYLTPLSDHDRKATQKHINNAVDKIVENATKLNRASVRKILESVFPCAQNPEMLDAFGGEFNLQDDWYSNFRACHPNVFDRYFLFRLAKRDISHNDIKTLLGAANKKRLLKNILQDLKDRRLFSTMLHRLAAYNPTIRLSSAIPLIAVLLNIGDDNYDDSDGEYPLGPERHALRIILCLLRREPNRKMRGKMLLDAISKSHGIYLIAEITESVKDRKLQRERIYHGESFINKSDLEKMNSIFHVRMENYTKSGALLKNVRLGYLLKRWSETDDVKPKKWLRALVSSGDDSVIKQILVGFVSPSIMHPLGSNFALSQLEKYVSINKFASRVHDLNDNDLNQMEKCAKDLFVKSLREDDSDMANNTDNQ